MAWKAAPPSFPDPPQNRPLKTKRVKTSRWYVESDVSYGPYASRKEAEQKVQELFKRDYGPAFAEILEIQLTENDFELANIRKSTDSELELMDNEMFLKPARRR